LFAAIPRLTLDVASQRHVNDQRSAGRRTFSWPGAGFIAHTIVDEATQR
jgi:hypothetical protein